MSSYSDSANLGARSSQSSRPLHSGPSVSPDPSVVVSTGGGGEVGGCVSGEGGGGGGCVRGGGGG